MAKHTQTIRRQFAGELLQDLMAQSYNGVFLYIYCSLFNAYYFYSEIYKEIGISQLSNKQSFTFCHSRFDSLQNLEIVRKNFNYGEK